MHPFFIYLIQVNIALALFYLLYATLLKNDFFLLLRRFYFLAVIVFSLVYALWTIPALADIPLSFISLEERETIVSIEEQVATIAIGEDAHVTTPIPWSTVVRSIYFCVTVLFFFNFLVQCISIIRLKKKCVKCRVQGVSVFQLSDGVAPFSFFKLIFICLGEYSEGELSQILLHEQTHARQWHSIDTLLIELLGVFCWWNPFVWLMKREMVLNLEYLADNGVLRKGIDHCEYQYHLLQLTVQESGVQLVNNFNVSQLKQRIMMMNKTKTSALKLMKYMLIIPLAFLLILANSCMNQDKKSKSEIATETERVTISPDKTETAENTIEEAVVDNSEIFAVVEVQPEFPGGNVAMMRFITEKLKYPVEAIEKNVQGRVICNFVVEKDGRLSDFNIVKGVDPLLDAEAIRVLNTMPNWIPGKQRGENVRVRFTLPVVFRLQGNDDKKTATSPPPPPPPRPKSSETNEIFEYVDSDPEFPGGTVALNRFLSDKIKYPVQAQENGIQGKVICSFIVEKDGKLNDFNVVGSVDPVLDNEAIRVLKTMPNWKPGILDNKTVRVRYTLPVVFKLQN